MKRKNQLALLVCLVCLVYVIGPANQIFQVSLPVFRLCCVEVPER